MDCQRLAFRVLDKLREYAPLYIVRGNNDKDWAEELPQSLLFSIEGIHFLRPQQAVGVG